MRKEDRVAIGVLAVVVAGGLVYWLYTRAKTTPTTGTGAGAGAGTGAGASPGKLAPIIIVPVQPKTSGTEQGVVTGASGGTGTVRVTTPPPSIPGTVRVPFSSIEPGTSGWVYLSPGQPYTIESPVTGKVYKVLAPAKEGGRTVVYEVR
ncbi:MAG: hypothetical protein QXQ53_03820 [Candidatus Methanosuratincola sp.]